MRPGHSLPLPHGPVLMLTCPLLALFRLVCDYAAPKTINCNACSSLIVDCELLLMYVELLMHIHLNLCQISNVKQLNLPIILVLNQWSSVPVTGSKVEVACEGFLTLTSSSPFPWMLPRNVQDSNCKRRWCNLICRRSVTLRSLLLQEVNKLWNQTSTLFLLLFHMRTHTHSLQNIRRGKHELAFPKLCFVPSQVFSHECNCFLEWPRSRGFVYFQAQFKGIIPRPE